MVSRMSADLRLGWGVIVLAVGWMGLQLTMAQNAKGVAVEKLFPKRTVMYATYDGGDRHQEGWKKTAAYESLHGSGMMSFLEKLFKEGAKHAESADDDFKLIQQGAELIISRGYTSGICLMDVGLPVPIPQAVVVVHEGGVLVPHIGTLLSKLPDLEEIAEEKIEGRSVQVLPIPDSPPGLAVSWWDEGGIS